MKSKLLNKTLKVYLLASSVAFIIGIPVFYYTVQHLWLEDLDDSLRYQKEELMTDGIDNNVRIMPLDAIQMKPDSIYFYEQYDSLRGHVEPFREIKAYGLINGTPSEICIRRDLVESADLLSGILWAMLCTFLLMFLTVFAVSFAYSKRIWRPFYNIVERLKTIEMSTLTTLDVPDKSIVEFDVLTSNINRLIYHNHQLFQAQKRFSENAAHEIQTPLAVIKGQIEMLYVSDTITERFTRYARIEKQVKTASSICKGLLLLTKIENRQYELREEVSITDIIRNFYDSIAEELEIIHKDMELRLENVSMKQTNETLLTICFSNLLNNAIKYSSPNTVISVTLTSEGCTIANDGVSCALDETAIFSRFYRENHTVSGTGLGLAIAKEIAQMLNMKLEYGFRPQATHVFTVLFPQPSVV